MKTIYSKEEFDRLFPKGEKQSDENMRRIKANLYLSSGLSLKDTYDKVMVE